MLVSQILAHVDFLDKSIATPSQRIEEHLAFSQRRLSSGVDRRAAEVILAETALT